MLGQYIYGAMDGGSLTSQEALADPFGPRNTIEGDYLGIPHLRGVITDTHFKERDRLGRLFAFVAKAQSLQPENSPQVIGLGVDESAALAVEGDGTGRVFATADDGYAWIVYGNTLPKKAQSGPLEASAVKVSVAGKSSVVHLPSGEVEAPFAQDHYAVSGGVMRRITP